MELMEAPLGEPLVKWHGIDVPFVLFCALGWELAYHASKRVFRTTYAEYPKAAGLGGSYGTAFLNALICSLTGGYTIVSLLFEDEADKALMNIDTSFAALVAHRACSSFLGWLLMDMLHLATHYPELGGMDMVAHHACFTLLGVLATGFRIAPFVAGWLLFGEFSSLFLNVRWLLINTGRGHTRMLTRANYGFAISFFLCRVVAYTLGCAHILLGELPFLLSAEAQSPAWAVLLLAGLVFAGGVLNAVWFRKIIAMATKGPPPNKQRPETMSPRTSETSGLAVDGNLTDRDCMSDSSETLSPV